MKKLLIISILIILTLSLFLTSCVKKDTLLDNPSGTQQPDPEIQKGILCNIIYYDVVENKKTSIEEYFSGSPEFMFSHLLGRISELTGLPIDYSYIDHDTENKNLTIDFLASGSPANGLGSAGESAVLDSITETVFENYPEINSIFFTCDGKAYKSGHVFLELGEAYRTRKIPEETIKGDDTDSSLDSTVETNPE